MGSINYRRESEEEAALFRSYPYALYFVQSPSSHSHANTNANANAVVYDSHSPLHLSRYSSSRGSNNSFPHHANKLSADQTTVDCIINKSSGDPDQDEDENENEGTGWIQYLSFGYSDSGWWILLQLSWRFLVSFFIASLVFYLAAKPPPPHFSLKIAGFREFRLGEGVDGSGVTTKILSCNCSIHLTIDNKSKLFDLQIHPPIIQFFFSNLPISQMKGREVIAGNDDTTELRLNVGIRNKAMYGAGRNMQDLLESGKGLPLVIKVSLRSRFHVIWGIIEPKYHHQSQCLVVLSDEYDKKHRTQVYNSTCLHN